MSPSRTGKGPQLRLAEVAAPSDDELARYDARPAAPATLRAYASDWDHFADWCASQRVSALPADPAGVCLYLIAHSQILAPATLERRLIAIRRAHDLAGLDTPTSALRVRNAMGWIRRERGTAQGGKQAFHLDDLRLAIAALPKSLEGRRDAALLLIGWAGALRRSELVALDVADVKFTRYKGPDDAERREGLVLTVRRGKTDQEGAGRSVGVPEGKDPDCCPVRALRAWLEGAGIEEGPLLRGVSSGGNALPQRLSDRTACRIVQRAAARVGLDPSLYGGHSLRAGLVTSASEEGATLEIIMAQTGHKSEKVARGYIRRANLFRSNAASIAGL